jgi:hypothetical protein
MKKEEEETILVICNYGLFYGKNLRPKANDIALTI